MAQKKRSSLSRLRMMLWGMVVIVGIGASVLYLVRPPERPLGVFGGEFTMQSTGGGAFDQDDLRGIPSLVFFGYTFCPDVCPTTLAESSSWMQELNLTGDDLRLIFVSVDPERDTLEALTDYLSVFNAPVIGLTGPMVEVEKAKKAFGIYSKRVEDESSTEYLIDHTASIFMINTDGRFEGTISFGEARDTAMAKIRKLLDI